MKTNKDEQYLILNEILKEECKAMCTKELQRKNWLAILALLKVMGGKK